MQLISFLVFVFLQILFLPLALVDVLLVGYRQMVVRESLHKSPNLCTK